MKYSFFQVKAAKGKLQSYANRLVLEKVFDPSTWFIANFTSLTANQLSIIGFFIGIVGAFLFASGHFILGAIGWELANWFDTFDGRIARLRKSGGSRFGEYLDAYGGFWVLFFMVFGLSIGIYNVYHNVPLLVLCFFFFFVMTVHFTEGLLVGYLAGGRKAYKEAVLSVSGSKKQGFVTRLLTPFFRLQVKLTERFGLEEPFNITDVEHIALFLTPVFSVLFFPVYYEVFIFLSVILILKAVIWWFRYSVMLKNLDKNDN